LAKRAFKRRGGILIDHYEDPLGQRGTIHIAASMYGECLPEDVRLRRLDEVGSADSGPAFEATHSLSGDRSPELLTQLLKGLAANSPGCALPATQFLDDPRVQRALLEATPTAAFDRVENFAQALGIVGGPGAKDVLRLRLSELEADPRTFDDDSFFNSRAGSLATCAHALLDLDADAEDAAQALVRLFTHPCPFNRRSAIRNTAEVFRPDLKTRAMRMLREHLEPLLQSDDPDLFTAAAPALETISSDAMLNRAERLLDETDPKVRRSAVFVLMKLKHLRARATLLRRLPNEPSPYEAVLIATQLGELLPPSLCEAVARRAFSDDSPAVRLHALHLLRLLNEEAARTIASTAIGDEPDPLIKQQLASYTA